MQIPGLKGIRPSLHPTVASELATADDQSHGPRDGHIHTVDQWEPQSPRAVEVVGTDQSE